MTLWIRLIFVIGSFSQSSLANQMMKSPPKAHVPSPLWVKLQIKLLNNLNIHKAPGPFGLSARVLKECSSEIAPILTYIFNESLAQGAVPDDWRQANVAPVFKKGEKYDAANYQHKHLALVLSTWVPKSKVLRNPVSSVLS